MKDYPHYKYMNAGSPLYRRRYNGKTLGQSAIIWVGIIAVAALLSCLG